MNATLLPAWAPTAVGAEGSDAGADEHHVYCCNPDVALCGTDISGHDFAEDNESVSCVVCVDLDGEPCSPNCPGPSGGQS